MKHATSLPFEGENDNNIREDVVERTRPTLTVIAGGKIEDKTTSGECEHVKNQTHNILFFRSEMVLLNMLKYMSDKDLECYLQSSVRKEGFNRTVNKITYIVRYLLRKWGREYGDAWSTYKRDVGHFMGNYFG